MKINSNSIELPENFDVKFFRDSLENGLRESEINICDVNIELGSNTGDNYCSFIYRVQIKFQRKKSPQEVVNLIVKSIRSGPTADFIQDMNFYLREKIFYYDILPRMEILIDNTQFAAKCLHTVKEPVNTFVFEDLKESGYVMGDRQTGLDEAHCKIVLKKLGKFHAGGMILAKKMPSLVCRNQTGILDPDILDTSKVVENIFSKNFENLLTAVEQWKGFESIHKKLQKYFKNMIENLKICSKPEKNEIKVLLHGDMWVNNLMFKYDEKTGQPINILFLDFQLGYFSSPGIDINYFLNTSVELSVLQNLREDLIKTYYDSLRETLADHRYDNIPSYDAIRNEVAKREGYGFFSSFAIFPIVSMDKESSGNSSIDSLLDDEAHKKITAITFSSKRFQTTMKYSLKRFDDLGVFD